MATLQSALLSGFSSGVEFALKGGGLPMFLQSSPAVQCMLRSMRRSWCLHESTQLVVGQRVAPAPPVGVVVGLKHPCSWAGRQVARGAAAGEHVK